MQRKGFVFSCDISVFQCCANICFANLHKKCYFLKKYAQRGWDKIICENKYYKFCIWIRFVRNSNCFVSVLLTTAEILAIIFFHSFYFASLLFFTSQSPQSDIIGLCPLKNNEYTWMNKFNETVNYYEDVMCFDKKLLLTVTVCRQSVRQKKLKI